MNSISAIFIMRASLQTVNEVGKIYHWDESEVGNLRLSEEKKRIPVN
jgi:hypothetical protein